MIGRIVKSGYAFDNNGFYLGFVTYNGEVVENEKLVGRLRADGNVVNPEGVVIGYSLDIASTATDLKGKYLGRIMPEGNLAGRVNFPGWLAPAALLSVRTVLLPVKL